MAIEIKNASFEYISGNPVFREVTCSLAQGEILSVIGPNGCGKTTLLQCILGILELSRGAIVISAGQRIGYVPQEHHAPFPYTVKEMVVMGRAHRIGLFSVPKKEDEDAAMRWLEALSITRLAEKPYTEISGGEKQLVRIARALASGGAVLLLDEPAASLDFKNQQLILEVLRKLSHEKTRAIIMTTHHPQHALSVSDKVLLMSSGIHPPIYGNTADVLTEENVKRIYGVDAKIISLAHEHGAIKGVIPISHLKN